MNYIKNTLVDLTGYIGVDNSNRITKNIYLGNYNSTHSEYISKLKFNVIINCTPDLPFQSDHTSNYRISVYDDMTFYSNLQLLEYITKILPVIKKHDMNNEKILIHCRAGMQRSATVVAAYLMKYYNISLNESISFIQKNRPYAFLCGANFNSCLTIFDKHCIKST